MAYTKTNEIQTRISLKYDSFATWQSKNPVLLKGEVAIATIDSGATTNPQMQNLPNVVIKVGDGVNPYNDLKFVSALAADVHEWAKAANKPTYSLSEIVGAAEYRLLTQDANNHKYVLQVREKQASGSWGEWNNVENSSIDLSGIVSSVADHETRIGVVEGDLNTATTGLKARMTAAEAAIENITKADGGAIGSAINTAIQGLDANLSQEASTDGLALSLTQVDGVVTSISGSIKANTYDAHGAAAAVETRLSTGAIKDNADAIAKINGNDTGSSMREVASDVVTTAIDALDATKTQAAGNDGLALEIVQENGVIKSISGSIAANTYDAYGSAAAVKKELSEGAIKTNADAIDVIEGNDAGKSMREVATAVVETLDYDAYEAGNAEGSTISFVGTVSENNGVISATKRDLVFTDNYSASNPAATKKYVDDTVIASVADLNGAMHFEGVYETLPTKTHDGKDFVAGDVIIVGNTEYVFSNGAFVELGDEGAIAAALAALTLDETGAVDKTLVISQSNGKVSAEAKSIQIAQSQVTNLTNDLAAKLNESVFNDFKTNEFTPVSNSVNTLKANAETTGSVAHSIATALSNLTQTEVGSAAKTLKVKQENGKVTAEAIDIAIEQSQVNGLPGALEAKLNVSDFNTFKTDEFAPVKTAVDNMANTIAGQINALDATKDQAAGADGLALHIKQENGVITELSGSIKANTYDAYGAAAAVQGSTTHTVAEAYALADAAQTAEEVSTAINNKVATLVKEDTAVEGEFVTATSQANGVISVSRAKVNVKHLAQDENTYVLFNCGSAEKNI